MLSHTYKAKARLRRDYTRVAFYFPPPAHHEPISRSTLRHSSWLVSRPFQPPPTTSPPVLPTTPPYIQFLTIKKLPRVAKHFSPFYVARKMSSDADYASFLDKANAPPGGASTSSTGNRDSHKGAGFTTKSVDKDVDIPPSIKEVAGSEIYVSDSDEEFQAVGLKWDGEGEDIDEGKLFFF